MMLLVAAPLLPAARMLGLICAVAGAIGWSSPVAAQGAPLRIVTVGTSLTAVGGWQAPLEQALAACTGRPVTVVNLGVGSTHSGHGLTRVAAVLEARPEIVLYEFAMNDAYVAFNIPLETARANTLSFLDQVAPHARVLLMTMNPTHGEVAGVRPHLARYYDLYRQIAGERGLRLIDHAAAWGARSDLATAIPDGVHPTPEAASAVMVPAIARALCP